MRIACIVPPEEHKGCGPTRLGSLQMTDLVIKASEWLGHRPGEDFMHNVAIIFDRRPVCVEGMEKASGIANYFAEFVTLRFMPDCWGRGGDGDGRKMAELHVTLESIEEKDAIIIAWMGDKNENIPTCSFQDFLSKWEIDIDLKACDVHNFMVLVDTEARTAELVLPFGLSN